MPRSGQIKRFVLEYLGIKVHAGKRFLREFYSFVKYFGLNVPIPLFTLVVINELGQIVDLGTLNLIFTSEDEKTYSFTSNLLGELEEYRIKTKDILNIK